MLVDWSKFLPALLLLLPPIALFHGRRVRYRALDHGWTGYWRRTLALGLHSIDFGRATLGAWWLAESLSALPDASGPLRHSALLVQSAVLFLATTLQTLVCKRESSAHAPFTFVAGMIIGFMPPLIAGFALVLAVALAAGMRSPVGFFPILSGSLLAAGWFFTGAKHILSLAVIATAVSLPWLLTLLFPRRLVLSHLVRRSAEAGESDPEPR